MSNSIGNSGDKDKKEERATDAKLQSQGFHDDFDMQRESDIGGRHPHSIPMNAPAVNRSRDSEHKITSREGGGYARQTIRRPIKIETMAVDKKESTSPWAGTQETLAGHKIKELVDQLKQSPKDHTSVDRTNKPMSATLSGGPNLSSDELGFIGRGGDELKKVPEGDKQQGPSDKYSEYNEGDFTVGLASALRSANKEQREMRRDAPSEKGDDADKKNDNTQTKVLAEAKTSGNDNKTDTVPTIKPSVTASIAASLANSTLSSTNVASNDPHSSLVRSGTESLPQLPFAQHQGVIPPLRPVRRTNRDGSFEHGLHSHVQGKDASPGETNVQKNTTSKLSLENPFLTADSDNRHPEPMSLGRAVQSVLSNETSPSHEHKNSEHSAAHPLRHKDNESHTSKMELGSLFKEDEQEPSRLDGNGVDSKEPLSTSVSGKGAYVTEAPAGNLFNILSSSSFETKKGPSTSHLESSILHNAFFTKPEFDSKSASSTRSKFTAIYHVSSVTEYTSKPCSPDSYEDSKKELKENEGKPAAGGSSQKPSTLDNNESMQKYNWTTFGSASVSRHSPSSYGNLNKEVKEKEPEQMARATGLQLPTVHNKHQTPTSHRAPHKALDKAYEELTHQASIKPSQGHSSDASGSLNEASYPSFARHSAASIQNPPYDDVTPAIRSTSQPSIAPTCSITSITAQEYLDDSTPNTHNAPSSEHTNKVSKRELGPTKERESETAKERESEAAKEQELVADKERESETAKERGVDKHQGILDSTSTKSLERKEDLGSSPVLHSNKISDVAHDQSISSSNEKSHSTFGYGRRLISDSMHIPITLSTRKSNSEAQSFSTENNSDVLSGSISTAAGPCGPKDTPSKAVMSKAPKIDLRLSSEEQASYPRDDSHLSHENPPRPKHITDIIEIPYQEEPDKAPLHIESNTTPAAQTTETNDASIASTTREPKEDLPMLQYTARNLHTNNHMPQDHHTAEHNKVRPMPLEATPSTTQSAREGHSKAVGLRKPRPYSSPSISLEEQTNYPRSDIPTGPARELKPSTYSYSSAIPIKEIQLDEAHMHPHHDLHPNLFRSPTTTTNQRPDDTEHLLGGISSPDIHIIGSYPTTTRFKAPMPDKEAMHRMPAAPSVSPPASASAPAPSSAPTHAALDIQHQAVPTTQMRSNYDHRKQDESLYSTPTSPNSMNLDTADNIGPFKPKGTSRSEESKDGSLPLMHRAAVHLLAAPELKRHHDATKPTVADSATASSTHNQPIPPVSVIQSKYLRQPSSSFVPSEHRHELSTCSSPDNPDGSEEQYFSLDETEPPNSNQGSGMSGINNNNKDTDLSFKAITSTLTPSIEAYKKDTVTTGSPVPTTSTTGATVRTPASQPHEDHAYKLKPSKEATANATAPKAQVTSDSSVPQPLIKEREILASRQDDPLKRAERGPMSVVPPAGAPAYGHHHATAHSHNEKNDSRPIHSAAAPAEASPVARAALPSAIIQKHAGLHDHEEGRQILHDWPKSREQRDQQHQYRHQRPISLIEQQNEIKTVTPTVTPATAKSSSELHEHSDQQQQGQQGQQGKGQHLKPSERHADTDSLKATVPPAVVIPTTTSKSDRAESHKYQEQIGSVKENDDITSAKPVSTQPKIDPTLLATPTTKPMVVGMQEVKMPSRPPAPKPSSAQTHGALYNSSEITPTPQIHEKTNFAKHAPVSASMDTAASHNHVDSMKVPVAQLPKKEQDIKISPISTLASDNKDKYKGEDMNNSNTKGDLTAEKFKPVPQPVIPPQRELAVSNSVQAPITTTESPSSPIPAPRPATMVSVAAVPAAALTPDRHGTELSRDVNKLKTNERQYQQGQEHGNVNAQVPVNTAMSTPSPIPVPHPTTMASVAAVPGAALTPGRHDNALTYDISKLKATEPAEQSQQHREHSNARAQTPVSGTKSSSSPIPAPRPIAMASVADMPAATLTSGRHGTERNYDISNLKTSEQHYYPQHQEQSNVQFQVPVSGAKPSSSPIPAPRPIAMASVASTPAAALTSGRHGTERSHDINNLRTSEQHYPQPQGQSNLQLQAPVSTMKLSSSPIPAPHPTTMASVAAAPVAALASGRLDNEPRRDINKLRTFEQQYPQPQGQNNVQVLSTEVPAGYKGEIPTTQDGEHVIWVKKIYTTREYYDPPDEYEPEELDEFGFRKDRDVSLYLNRRYP